jgi:hypothetical protein
MEFFTEKGGIKSWSLACRKVFFWALLALLIIDLIVNAHTPVPAIRIATIIFGAVMVAIRLVLIYKRPNY